MSTDLTPVPGGASVPASRYVTVKRKGYPTIVRENRAGAKFTTRIRFRGKVHFVTLAETAEPSLKAALTARREIQAGRWEEYHAKTALRGFTSVADLLTRYAERIATVNDRIEPTTIENNVATFKKFLAWAAGTPEAARSMDFASLSVRAVLDADTVNQFKTHYLAVAGDDREQREQRRRGAASVLRQVRSLFSTSARLIYKDLQLPDLREFLEHARLDTEDRIHLTIGDDVLRAMHQAMETLRAAQSPLWLVHALHKFAGLRTSEICEARAEWFNRAPWGQVFLSVLTRPYFEPKQSQGHIPLAREVAAQIAPFVAGKSGQDYLIPAASPHHRRLLVEREHAQWIRTYLPAGRYAKAGYELRRWGSQIMRSRYGAAAGEAFLRHSTDTVAARHYFEHFYPWQTHGTDIGIRIADAAGQEQSKIVQIWTEGAAALQGLDAPAAGGSTSLLTALPPGLARSRPL